MYGWGAGWGMMLIGGLVMLLFWSIVIALAVWAIRALTRSERNRGVGGSSTLHENSTLETLKQRYARGEISREEYQSMRQRLQGKRDLES